MQIITKETVKVGGDPYLTRYLFPLGYRLHVFHRGDTDPDCHDHPWEFWTFPLTAYVEDVWVNGVVTADIVDECKWHHRTATYTHRIVGPLYSAHPNNQRYVRNRVGNYPVARRVLPLLTRLSWWWFGVDKIVTIVRTGPVTRSWGFQRKVKAKDPHLKNSYVWTPWKEYVARVRNWVDM